MSYEQVHEILFIEINCNLHRCTRNISRVLACKCIYSKQERIVFRSALLFMICNPVHEAIVFPNRSIKIACKF